MEDNTQLKDNITQNFNEAEKAKKSAVSSGFAWDDREQLFYGIYKSPAEEQKDNKPRSLYSTGELQSLVLDSACRVMAQMATGRFYGLDDSQIPKVIAANLVYHEHILPNARTGGDFFTKARQVNIYSKVYGTMPAFIDYIVSKEYTGPDLILIHPRRFYNQPGKYSIADMDWCFVDVPMTKAWLEARAKSNPEIWDPKVIESLTESAPDQSILTEEEKKAATDRKGIVLRNYFTREGDWTLYDSVSKKVIFEKKDFWPGIPMVEKMTVPVLDRYWGLSDYERGETPQKSIDALVRRYLAAVEKSINPTTVMDPENMVMSSVNPDNPYWFAKNGKTQEPRVLEVSPQGLQTFPLAYNIMKANLLSLGAQTDTGVDKNTDVGFGKTPQALKMQGAREGARDSWDRYMQEKFLEDTANMMMKVAAKRGMDQVKIPGIQKALEKIKAAYPEKELAPFQNGIIGKEYLTELNIRYKVDPGSTAKKDDAGEKLMGFLKTVSESKDIMTALAADNKKINWAKALKRVAIDNALQDWDEIIVDAGNPNSVAGVGDEGGTIIRPGETEPVVTKPAEQLITTPAPEEVPAV